MRSMSAVCLVLVGFAGLACSDDSTGGRASTGSAGAGNTGGGGPTTGGAGTTGSSATTGVGGNPATGSTASTTATTASGGTAGSSTGAGGAGGGAGSSVDAGSGGSSGAGGQVDAGSGDGSFPPIMECTKPSVDRLEQWEASGEGTTVPATGNTLVKQGNVYVSKIQFVGSQWHVMPVYLGNMFGAKVDLTKSSGFLLTYSSTSDMYVQLR